MWKVEVTYGASHQSVIWRELHSRPRFTTEEEAADYADVYERISAAEGVEVDTRLREVE